MCPFPTANSLLPPFDAESLENEMPSSQDFAGSYPSPTKANLGWSIAFADYACPYPSKPTHPHNSCRTLSGIHVSVMEYCFGHLVRFACADPCFRGYLDSHESLCSLENGLLSGVAHFVDTMWARFVRHDIPDSAPDTTSDYEAEKRSRMSV